MEGGYRPGDVGIRPNRGGPARDLPVGIELRAIRKSFGAVEALKGVDFSVRPGEVVGLVGDNGAGKSTLAKIMSGALRPDEGEIVIDGSPVSFSSIRDARARGITMIFQDLALCDDLDVADNFYVGREPTRFRVVRYRWMHDQTRQHLEALDVRLPSTKLAVRLLSGGQRQTVAIARAVSFSPRVLILDEPTAALGVRQARATLEMMNRLRTSGIGQVFISHRMNDVLAISDRVIVLYEGKFAAELPREGLSMEELVRCIVTDPDHRNSDHAGSTSGTR
jgi:simple sugar transport system ATP-binding protein